MTVCSDKIGKSTSFSVSQLPVLSLRTKKVADKRVLLGWKSPAISPSDRCQFPRHIANILYLVCAWSVKGNLLISEQKIFLCEVRGDVCKATPTGAGMVVRGRFQNNSAGVARYSPVLNEHLSSPGRRMLQEKLFKSCVGQDLLALSHYT